MPCYNQQTGHRIVGSRTPGLCARYFNPIVVCECRAGACSSLAIAILAGSDGEVLAVRGAYIRGVGCDS